MGLSNAPEREEPSREERYVGWFHELDAWTEYWDIYHPETHGRFYFGDGAQERGLLSYFLPRPGHQPPPFQAWKRPALYPRPPAINRPTGFVPALRAQADAGWGGYRVGRELPRGRSPPTPYRIPARQRYR